MTASNVSERTDLGDILSVGLGERCHSLSEMGFGFLQSLPQVLGKLLLQKLLFLEGDLLSQI